MFSVHDPKDCPLNSAPCPLTGNLYFSDQEELPLEKRRKKKSFHIKKEEEQKRRTIKNVTITLVCKIEEILQGQHSFQRQITIFEKEQEKAPAGEICLNILTIMLT